jgi:hypothetical protein
MILAWPETKQSGVECHRKRSAAISAPAWRLLALLGTTQKSDHHGFFQKPRDGSLVRSLRTQWVHAMTGIVIFERQFRAYFDI